MGDKKRVKQTRYERLAKKAGYGKPLFHGKIRYCVRCCMPETAEGLAFDEMGICQPCRSSEQKIHINWKEREAKLRKILEKYRSKDGSNYDCIVPISGGKDSTFQLYVVTQVYKLNPLAVTFNHNWYSETGKYNLENALERFDVDHIMFTPKRSAVNKLAKKSLQLIGDTCWHCHAGVGAFPLQIAVKYKIKLLIWGEPGGENHGRATYFDPIPYDRDYFTKISARYYAEEVVDKNISLSDVLGYVLPSKEEVEKAGIVGIYLGDYMFWDDERQTEFVRDNFGWREDKIEGTYKGYKSAECRMAGMHDYSKFIKRGFGRGTDHASIDVRTGLLTREEGFELAKKHDAQRPSKSLDYYLKITGYSEKEFEKILKDKRDKKAKLLP
ncbi:MAG: N-acetyl sugar amidotransferase [Candidatus Omnitrophica bacterium]|nr:N-acetyl sugar amidotransferase [Candidatus Omnitrophota bacterium]MDD5310586.1 N-acetyl sugar amidotransferase [Candidatus Omnitrophota bacterium]MDD5545988.1 N-acetyl sugar amidotransferase [Candidatus Omnitrophota bacterium]